MVTAMEARTTTIESPKFGEVSFTENEVIEFPWGLPGFSDLRGFLALSLAEQPSFVWLQSVDNPAIALPAADPWQFFPEYEPRLPAYAVESLDIQGAEDFTILCVVVVTKDAEEMTMNLMAPVVVNLKTRQGRQVMLEGTNYSVRTAIPRKESERQGTAQPA